MLRRPISPTVLAAENTCLWPSPDASSNLWTGSSHPRSRPNERARLPLRPGRAHGAAQRFQLLGRHPFRQRRIRQEAALLIVEQVAQLVTFRLRYADRPRPRSYDCASRCTTLQLQTSRSTSSADAFSCIEIARAPASSDIQPLAIATPVNERCGRICGKPWRPCKDCRDTALAYVLLQVGFLRLRSQLLGGLPRVRQ